MITKTMPILSRTSKVLGVDRFGNTAFTDYKGIIWVGLNKENIYVSQETPKQIKWVKFILECCSYALC